MSFTISYARLSLHSSSRCRCSGTMRPYHLFVVHFPGYKRERNESSGRRPGGHFRRKKLRWNEEKGARERAKRLLKAEERKEKENRRGGLAERDGRKERGTPHHGGKHSGYRDCAAATLSIIHLAPGPMYANYYPIPETGRATGNSCSHANSLVRGWSTYQDCLCSFLFPLPLFLCLCIAFSLALLLFVLFFHAGSLGFSRPLCTVPCKLQGRETTSLRLYTYVKRNWP